MTAALDLLDRLAEIGAGAKLDGGWLTLRTGSQPIPGELLQEHRQAKAEMVAALAAQEAGHGSQENLGCRKSGIRCRHCVRIRATILGF